MTDRRRQLLIADAARFLRILGCHKQLSPCGEKAIRSLALRWCDPEGSRCDGNEKKAAGMTPANSISGQIGSSHDILYL